MHERYLWYNCDKKTLAKLLTSATAQHLMTRGVEHLIAENGVTHSSCSREGVTNRKELETAISLGLPEMELKQQKKTWK